MNNSLIILEGPDYAGKSKLAFHLIDKYKFNYYHCIVQPDILKYHLDVLNVALNDINKYSSNYVIDRLHLSEYVYGSIFRNGPQYDYKKLNNYIENKFNNYKLIICLPPKDIVINGHKQRLKENNEMFSTVDKVYDMYNNIVNNKDVKYYIYDFTKDSNYKELDKYLEV